MRSVPMADRDRTKDSTDREKEAPTPAQGHEEDIVGKAYDGRLMRRLLTYLRPYKWQATFSLIAILLKAGSDVLGPYLTKVAVDRYMTADTAGHPRQTSWLARHLSANAAHGITEIAFI